MREAEAGETIVITRGGKPSVQLQRVEPKGKARPAAGMTLWDALKDAPKAQAVGEELVIDLKADAGRNDHFQFDPE